MENIVMIEENIEALLRKKYLTQTEMEFVLRLGDILQQHTNSIAVTTADFMTIEEIAKHLQMESKEVEQYIRSLVKKGIIFEFISKASIGDYDPLTSKRPLFMNPEIMYKGDPQMVDSTLCTLVAHFDKISKKVELPFKLFLAPDLEYGGIFPKEWVENFLEKITYEV